MGLTPGGRRLAKEQTTTKPLPQGTAQWRAQNATVTTVTAGAASDGNALVTVTYGGAAQKCAYLASYTPVVNDTVVLLVSSDGALLCLGKPIGTP